MSRRALEGLGLATALAGALFVAAAVSVSTIGFWYLVWNLLLAYIPLALTFPLVRAAERYGWRNWRAVAWGVVWLAWLPNSFYVLSDMTHLLEHSYGLDPLVGVVLFGSFAALGMTVGFMSMMAAHKAMRRQAGAVTTYVVAEIALLVSSVAIYAGRTLRFNTWDAVLHPVLITQQLWQGLLALDYLELLTTLTFFVVLSGAYAALWHVFGEHE